MGIKVEFNPDLITEATHFAKNGEIYTKGLYRVDEVINELEGALNQFQCNCGSKTTEA